MTKLSSILMSVALCASACSKKDNQAPAPNPKVSVTPTPAPAHEAPKASTVTIDPEVQRLVKEIVAKCDVQPEYMQVSCNGNEAYAVIDYAAQKKLTSTFESLAEIALTDGAKDPKVLTAVLATWNTFRDVDLQKKNSTPAAAERVLKLYPLAAKASAFSYAAGIPLVAGKRAELTAVLDKLPADSNLKARSIESYLDGGGIAALPDVQNYYKTSTDDGIRSAALWSVGVALGGVLAPGQVSDADKTQMCDWVKSVVKDPAASGDSQAFAGAIESLSRCKGAYIDDALAAIASRLATMKLNERLANGLNHMCWAEAVVGGTPNGSKEQCAKAFSTLEKAMAVKDVDKSGLEAGLFAAEYLGKNSPDLKSKAKALIGKFASNKDVGKTAKDSLGRLK